MISHKIELDIAQKRGGVERIYRKGVGGRRDKDIHTNASITSQIFHSLNKVQNIINLQIYFAYIESNKLRKNILEVFHLLSFFPI